MLNMRVSDKNNVVVEGVGIIKTNESLDYYERERQAYDIIDYLLEDPDHIEDYEVVEYE